MVSREFQLDDLASTSLVHFFKDYESIILSKILEKLNVSILDVLNIDDFKYFWDDYIRDIGGEWLTNEQLEDLIDSGDLENHIKRNRKDLQKEVIWYLEDNQENCLP